jgi:hypothetical protein
MPSTIIPVYHALKIKAASYGHKMIMQMVGMHTTSDRSKYDIHFSGSRPDEPTAGAAKYGSDRPLVEGDRALNCRQRTRRP